MEVTDSGGRTDTAIITIGLNDVNEAPAILDADLILSAATIDENSALTITGSFADPDTGDTHTVTIDWGDSNSDILILAAGDRTFSATHQYPDDNPTGTPADNYTINATVTDADMETAGAGTTVTVNNVAPVLSDLAAIPINENGVTTLTGTITDPGTLDTFTLEVNWGDPLSPNNSEVVNFVAGTTSFALTHQYLDDNLTGTPQDTYTISTTVTDDDGASASDTTTVQVNNIAPVLSDITATSVAENGTVSLMGNITDPGTLDTFTLVVDWGEGLAEIFNYAAGATSFSETHQYLDDDPSGTPADTYTIDLILTDDDTGQGLASTTTTISNVAPVLSDVSATSTDENGTLTLSGTITDLGTQDTFTLTVDWGEGVPEAFNYAAGTTSFSETHQYLDDDPSGTPADSYTIALTLADDDTGSDTAGTTATITNVAPKLVLDPVAAIDENGVATLTGTISDPGTLDTFMLDVDWGDPLSPNNVEQYTIGASATGTQTFMLTHQYLDDNPSGTASDTYDIIVTVEDDDTGVSSETATLTVKNLAPEIVALTGSAEFIGVAAEGEPVTISGSFTDVGRLDNHEASIDWGDGSNTVALIQQSDGSGSISGAHTYELGGIYTVTISLSDDDLGVAVATTTAMITGMGVKGGMLVIVGTDEMDEVIVDRPAQLIAYWNFNETGGRIVADSAGTPRNGTFFGHHPDLDDAGPPVSRAPFGAATGADFHRTVKEYIGVAHDEAFEVDRGTIGLWFKTRKTSGDQTLFSKDHLGYVDGGHLNIGLDGSRLKARLQSMDDSFYIRTGKLIHKNTWYHLAFTFGEKGMQLYLDGELVGENNFSGGLAANAEPIVIGGSLMWNYRDPGDLSRLKIKQPFNGYIDEVAFFNEVLDPDQIRQMMVDGPTGTTSDNENFIRVQANFLPDPGQRRIVSAEGHENIKIYLGEGDDKAVVDHRIALPLFAYGGDGNDELTAGSGPAQLFGGAGNDILAGGSANDVLMGQDGDDHLGGGGGEDWIDGGAGIDIIGSHALTPIAYWNLNETGGNMVADSAGTPQNGTFYARRNPDLDDAGPPASLAPFDAETGADFHRTTKEYIAVAHDPVFEVANGTVQFWFNTDRTHGRQTMFSKDHSGFVNGGHLNIGLDGSRIEVRLQSADKSHSIRTGKLVKSRQWYHLAFSFGEQGMKLYLDGELAGENDFTGGLTANREALVIGGSIRTNRDESGDRSRLRISDPFNGYIDEAAIFSGALDPEQIRRLKIAGPQQLIDEAAAGDTIDGTDRYRNVEQLHLADGSRAYLLGTGSENASELSAEDVQEVSRTGRLVVLGDANQVLRLIGIWVVDAPDSIGPNTFGRYTNGAATVLVLDGVNVLPDAIASFLVPIAYWDFNETSGNVVADSAGTAQDGTFFARHPDLDDSGPPDSVAPFGAETGADFHRTTREYIAVAHDPVFELDSGTVQLWFNPDKTYGKQTLLSKDHAGFKDGGHLDISLDGSRIEVRLQGTDKSYTIRTDKIVHAGTWYHLAFTFGEGGMKLYLNGKLMGENAFTGGLLGNREPIVIGGSLKWNSRDTDDLSKLYIRKPFNGRIDEVAIYDQALDADQIMQLVTEGPLNILRSDTA